MANKAATKVTIDSGEKTESGTSKNGKPFTERYQEAFLHTEGARYPKSCRLRLYDNARPWPVGDYETDQDLEVNEFGALRVRSSIELRHAQPAAVDAAKRA